jgi:hypothetical protein
MLQTLLLVHSQLLIVHREIVPVVGNGGSGGGGGGTGASIHELITNAVVRARAHVVNPATVAVPHYPSMHMVRSKRRKVSPIDETSDSTTKEVTINDDNDRKSIDSEPTNESITRSLNFRAELMAIMNHPTGVESVRTGGQRNVTLTMMMMVMMMMM